MKQIKCNKEQFPFGNGRFVCAKSESLMKALVSEYANQATLVYIDPPFCTGSKFTLANGTSRENAFFDNMSEAKYLQIMRTVLRGAYEILSNEGSIYVHIDYRMSAKIRGILDKIFGESNFQNEIIWAYNSGGRAKHFFPRKHDNILVYKKGKRAYFNIEAVGKPRGTIKRNNMKRSVDTDGRVFFSIKSNGKLYKYYEDDLIYPTDVWTDIGHLQQKDSERVNYPTQKPKELLRRILLASSYEGALVCDFFSGSGTTAIVAEELNRRWLAVDSSPFAAFALRKRLIDLYSMGGLLFANDSITFEYPNKADKMDVYAFMKGNTLVVANEGENRIEQVSTGYIENNIFIPKRSVIANKKTQIRLGNFEESALHIIDSSGRHGFFIMN